MRGRRLPIGLAVAAFIGLAGMDMLIVAAAFLGQSTQGAWLLGGGLLIAGAGIWTRQAWLLFAAQNLVLSGAFVTLFRADPPPNVGETLQWAVAVLIGNLLVWPIARALRPAAAYR